MVFNKNRSKFHSFASDFNFVGSLICTRLGEGKGEAKEACLISGPWQDAAVAKELSASNCSSSMQINCGKISEQFFRVCFQLGIYSFYWRTHCSPASAAGSQLPYLKFSKNCKCFTHLVLSSITPGYNRTVSESEPSGMTMVVKCISDAHVILWLCKSLWN